MLSSRATEAYEKARQRVAEYIGAASPDEIIFTRGTTESINLVAQAWGGKFIREGDVILLTVMEHHSNLVPWQLLAERSGARLRFLPVRDDGTLDVEQLSSFLTPEVKLFAFTHISNSLGTINPVAELCAKARAVGALTLVDAAQSVGHIPLDVQELGCDLLAFSGHKMCAPTGIGALYGRAELLDSMPPWHGGGEMIVSVTHEKSTFKKPARPTLLARSGSRPRLITSRASDAQRFPNTTRNWRAMQLSVSPNYRERAFLGQRKSGARLLGL
jgi:cysteine desulfurase/selenocysteine lyase